MHPFSTQSPELHRRVRLTVVVLALLLGGSLSARGSSPSDGAQFFNRDDLWYVAHDLCLADLERTGSPLPCTFVDPGRGFVILLAGAAHGVLVPTRRVSGLESPDLLQPAGPNYWEYAWEARSYLSNATGAPLPRDLVGLAVNSAQARTQDQLHIHIGCLQPEVRAALKLRQNAIGPTWSKRPLVLAGRRYYAMRINGETLADANPFAILADGIPSARADMASQTLAVAGAEFRDGQSGFYILTSRSLPNDPAASEHLLDYGCAGQTPRK